MRQPVKFNIVNLCLCILQVGGTRVRWSGAGGIPGPPPRLEKQQYDIVQQQGSWEVGVATVPEFVPGMATHVQSRPKTGLATAWTPGSATEDSFSSPF